MAKLVKYWVVELFRNHQTGLVVDTRKEPFFVGYAKEPVSMKKLSGYEFISLFTEPGGVTTKEVRISNIAEVVCSPVYEQDASFNEAAEPLIKWLAENVHPHHTVIVTSTGAELLQSEKSHLTDKFLVD